MDDLIFPQPTPAPLILPRRHSISASLRQQKARPLHSDVHQHHQQRRRSSFYGIDTIHEGRPLDLGATNGRDDLTHYYYFPASPFPAPAANSNQQQQPVGGVAGNNSNVSQSDTSAPPTIFGFSYQQAQDGSPPSSTAMATIRGQLHRRHSIASGSPWTTMPPRHALHMPVMKINPEVLRGEHHQREVHRLMREGREEEVMKRRGIRSVMDTSDEYDEDLDDENGNGRSMADIVLTMDLGGFRAAEERERERVREEVREEWARNVAEQAHRNQELAALRQLEEYYRRKSWPTMSMAAASQQQQQLQQQQIRQIQQQQQQRLLQQLYLQQQQQQQQQQQRQQQSQMRPPLLTIAGVRTVPSSYISHSGPGPLDLVQSQTVNTSTISPLLSNTSGNASVNTTSSYAAGNGFSPPTTRQSPAFMAYRG